MSIKKITLNGLLLILILGTLLFFIRDFNLSWVKVQGEQAIININFLFPMPKDALEDTLTIENNALYDQSYPYSIHWLNNRSCEIHITEKSSIKGQRVTLHINDAPTCYTGLSKNAKINVQFQTPIALTAPKEAPCIATHQSFLLQFNTPLQPDKIKDYLITEIPFVINPLSKEDANHKYIDDLTSYECTPRVPLENEKTYTFRLKKGLPAQSGSLLGEDIVFEIHTDKKPQITSVTPSDGSKWIGLYPRIIVESSTPMTKAYAMLGDTPITGLLKNPYYAILYPSIRLNANTTYPLSIWIESATGEKSLAKKINFTTVPLKASRLWIEVIQSSNTLNVYKGTEKIQTFSLISHPTEKNYLGTFYLQAKNTDYLDEMQGYGANYYLGLTEGLKIHGLLRDDYWHIKPENYQESVQGLTTDALILNDEDATWLYENLPIDTMVIIQP